MKILHIFHELKFSGAEIMYVAASEKFQALGCKLYAVNTASNMGEYAIFLEKRGFEVQHWPYNFKSPFKVGQYIFRVIKFLKDNRIDVVHIHPSRMRFLMAYCAWRAGCKSVYTFHSMFKSNWYSHFYHLLQRWIVKNIFRTKFQTISSSVFQHEKRYYLNKTVLIYNWFDTNSFYPVSKIERLAARRHLNISDDTLVLISVGGCSDIKRHHDIIRALPALKAHYQDLIYLHVGEGSTRVEEEEISIGLGVDNFIKFVGNTRKVRDYLVASDIYLMTSKLEGISLTTIEALACKIPAILYDVPGLRDFNRDAECAVLVGESPELLAQAIIELNNDCKRKEKISQNGYEFVRRNFDLENNAFKIYNLYKI